MATPRLFTRVFGKNAFFMFWMVLACLAGRYVNVYLSTFILNKCVPGDFAVAPPVLTPSVPLRERPFALIASFHFHFIVMIVMIVILC